MATRSITLCVALAILAAGAARGAAAGNLERFEHTLDFGSGGSRAHPVCGVEGWRTEHDPQSGVPLRLPVFAACRHLLTITGWSESPLAPRGERLLAEVLELLDGRTAGFEVWLGQGPAVKLAVPLHRWVPAGCESLLGPRFSLATESMRGPGTRGRPRPPGWVACQNRAVELFAGEYRREPEVVALDHLSRALDALDLDDPAALHRLQRVRLLLLDESSELHIEALTAFVEGRAQPRAQPVRLGFDPPSPFTASERAGRSLVLTARGAVAARLGGISIAVEEGRLSRETGQPLAPPVSVEAGLCYQPLDADRWRLKGIGTSRLTLGPQDGDLPLRKTFTMPMLEPINVRRYWVCFLLTDGAGKQSFVHADQAREHGCRACE